MVGTCWRKFSMSGYSPLQVGDAPSPKVPLQGQSLCPVCVAEILNTLQRPVQLPCQAISPAISWPICRNSAIATASLPGAHIYFVFSDRRSQNGPLVGHPPSSRTPPGGYERVTPLLPPPLLTPPPPFTISGIQEPCRPSPGRPGTDTLCQQPFWRSARRKCFAHPGCRESQPCLSLR